MTDGGGANGVDAERILVQVTEVILGRMRREGFRYRRRLRFDPVVWDINNGWCETWARTAVLSLPGSQVRWVTEDHCVLVWRGRFYDADRPGGVEDPHELPLFANPDEQRPEP